MNKLCRRFGCVTVNEQVVLYCEMTRYRNELPQRVEYHVNEHSLLVCDICASLFVGWLINVPATCECISGTDLLRRFYVMPH